MKRRRLLLNGEKERFIVFAYGDTGTRIGGWTMPSNPQNWRTFKDGYIQMGTGVGYSYGGISFNFTDYSELHIVASTGSKGALVGYGSYANPYSAGWKGETIDIPADEAKAEYVLDVSEQTGTQYICFYAGFLCVYDIWLV